VGVAPDQAGDDMLGQIAGHRPFASVQRGIAQPADAFCGLDLQSDEIAPWAGHYHFGGNDLEHATLPEIRRSVPPAASKNDNGVSSTRALFEHV
jgi:hypothetical protein